MLAEKGWKYDKVFLWVIYFYIDKILILNYRTYKRNK